jgi:hypothetical protein
MMFRPEATGMSSAGGERLELRQGTLDLIRLEQKG